VPPRRGQFAWPCRCAATSGAAQPPADKTGVCYAQAEPPLCAAKPNKETPKASQIQRQPAADKRPSRRPAARRHNAPPSAQRSTSPKRLRWNIRRHRVAFYLERRDDGSRIVAAHDGARRPACLVFADLTLSLANEGVHERRPASIPPALVDRIEPLGSVLRPEHRAASHAPRRRRRGNAATAPRSRRPRQKGTLIRQCSTLLAPVTSHAGRRMALLRRRYATAADTAAGGRWRAAFLSWPPRAGAGPWRHRRGVARLACHFPISVSLPPLS
jgi:hypothetical protein